MVKKKKIKCISILRILFKFENIAIKIITYYF